MLKTNPVQEIEALAVSLAYRFSRICIAGGCPRNIHTGLRIKDIDIFIQDEAMVPQICDYLHIAVIRDPLTMPCMDQYDEGERIEDDPAMTMKVYKCSEWDAFPHQPTFGGMFPVDLLVVPSIPDRIDYFPDNISKFWYDFRGQICGRTEAYSDAVQKRVTYHGKRIRTKRLHRLQDLYPDYKFVDLDNPAESRITKTRKQRDPLETPFYWELGKVNPSTAMDAVHALCGKSVGN